MKRSNSILPIMAIALSICGHAAASEPPSPQSEGDVRPTHETDRIFADASDHAQSPDLEAARALRLAGLSRETIAALQRQGFPYRRVRQAVEEAAIEQGFGRQNARRRAREIAQRVERMRAGALADERPFEGSSDAWRVQRVREMLLQAGLPKSAVMALARNGFPPREVREQIHEALLIAGYDEASAERRAATLASRIRRIRQENRAAPLRQEDQQTAVSTALNAIRESLREVGLSSRQIERLERRNFPYDQARILVQDKLEDLGYSPSRAERIGREVALQAGRWREYGERATPRAQDGPARLERFD